MCKAIRQPLRRGVVLMKTVQRLATPEKLKLYQIPDQSLVQEEGQWAPGPRNLSRT